MVPDAGPERDAWIATAGRVAAYRELRGHDDLTDALGPAPQPGQVEQFAAHRSAWRDLGRPEIDREHLELSNGQLRMRVRAYEREEAAAPRYVANELAGTREAATHQRQTAALRRAETENTADPAERGRLTTEATIASTLAQTLDAQAAELQEVDDARSRWLVHTAGSRLEYDLSKAELSARDADDDPDDRVTPLSGSAHDAAFAEDEQHREITEDDVVEDLLSDPTPVRDREDGHAADIDQASNDWRDLREEAATEPAPVNEDVVRVPAADETAGSLRWAGRVLDEIAYRDSGYDLHDDDRAQELTRWHDDDRTAENAADDHDGYADENC